MEHVECPKNPPQTSCGFCFANGQPPYQTDKAVPHIEGTEAILPSDRKVGGIPGIPIRIAGLPVISSPRNGESSHQNWLPSVG